VHDSALAAAKGADVIVLAVKPQVMKAVCVELAASIAQARPLLISIAAGIRIDQLAAWLGGELPIVRSMPNTPALIGAGATGMIANHAASAAQRDQAAVILGAAGTTVWIDDEDMMDTVTALSGSGPAYFFLLVEALEDAAVAQGLPRATARVLATQTCFGAGRMLAEDGEPPTVLRERVTSPGGTTAAALEAFADGNLRALVASAIAAATERGRELSERYS
jgi:pyrroline-5-carboxylate reductase